MAKSPVVHQLGHITNTVTARCGELVQQDEVLQASWTNARDLTTCAACLAVPEEMVTDAYANEYLFAMRLDALVQEQFQVKLTIEQLVAFVFFIKTIAITLRQ